MEKGINLSLTKSLARFDALLDRAIEAVSTKKLSVAHKVHKSRTNPINFEDIFDGIFSKKIPMAHEGTADGALSQDERDALLSGGDSAAAHEDADDTLTLDEINTRLYGGDSAAAHKYDDDDANKFRVGKYVKIDSDNKPTVFWIGYGWEENEKSESRL